MPKSKMTTSSQSKKKKRHSLTVKVMLSYAEYLSRTLTLSGCVT